MITSNKTNLPIISIYNKNDVKNFHLKPNAEPRETYYFNRESRDDTIINLENSFVLPYLKDMFSRYVIFGASGSGKTTLLSNIITKFNKDYNSKCLIIYISSLEFDKYLDEVFKKIGKQNIIKLTHKNFINNNPFIIEKQKPKKPDPKQDIKKKRTTGALSLDNQAKPLNNINSFNPYMKTLTPEQKKKQEEQERLKELRVKLLNTPFYDLDSLKAFIKKYYDDREVLVCFDDTESIPNDGNNKIIKQMIMSLQHQILTAGRKHRDDEHNINCLTIIHNIISGDMFRVVRTMLNEANYLCFSLHATSKGVIDKICNKFGLLQFKDVLQDLKKEGVNWVFISITFPFYILCDKKIIPIV